MSGYFKREGDRRRQIQGVAKPMLALLDWGMFNALLKKGNHRLIQTDAGILNRWIINCKNVRRTWSALRSTVCDQSVFKVMKITLKTFLLPQGRTLGHVVHSFVLLQSCLGGGGWGWGMERFASLRKPSVCLSVRPSAWKNLAPTQRIFTKFNMRTFVENLPRKLRFTELWQEQRVVYMKTNLHFRSFLAQFVL